MKRTPPLRAFAVVALVVVGFSIAAVAADPPAAPPSEAPKKDAPNKDAPNTDAPKKVDYEGDVQAFFDTACVVCHLDGGENGGLVLEQGESYRNLVGVTSTGARMKRVTANDIDKSYLLHKLKGTHLKVGGSGVQMPLGGAPPSAASVAILEAWINGGAKP